MSIKQEIQNIERQISSIERRLINARAAGGEANTASNIGVGGVGPYQQKVGVDLQFRNINAASARISVALDAGNNEVDIDAVEAQINHDNLLNFLLNEHINHTGVSIIAGVGLSGGGTIAADRTIDLDPITGAELSTTFGAEATNLHNFIPVAFANRSYFGTTLTSTSQAAFIFSGDINAAGVGGLTATNVPYDNDSREDSIVPGGAVDGYIVLHNLSRGTSRLITAVDPVNNVITTVASADAWADNDNLTAESQTIVGGAVRLMDLDLSNQIPATAIAVLLEIGTLDTGGVSTLRVHPYEAYGSGKLQQVRSDSTGSLMYRTAIVKAVSQKIGIDWDASGDNTANVYIRCFGWWENADT